MPKARANGLFIAYETFGDRAGIPILLVSGLGSQLLSWPVEFCRRLAAAGHFVVRFDNRDVGLSTRMEGAGIPDINRIRSLMASGKAVIVPYGLTDMAMDTLGLMDALALPKAHICGLSMGAMIGQTMAVTHPERMLSLVSMASTTGAKGLPPARPGVREAMLKPSPRERDPYVRYKLYLHRLFSGGSEFLDEDLLQEIAGLSFDRSFYPMGATRQYAAIVASGNRRPGLVSVKIPALVLHGDADALLPVVHARDTAAAIPGAGLAIIRGLGHGMCYPRLWDGILAAISTHTARIGP